MAAAVTLLVVCGTACQNTGASAPPDTQDAVVAARYEEPTRSDREAAAFLRERKLVEDFGYKPVGDTWRAAITVDAREAGVTAAQLKATRGMISRMVEAQAPRKKKAGT